MAKNPKFEIEFYESVLKRLPKDLPVIETLGCLYTQAGRIDEGLAMDQKAVLIAPKSAFAHYNLACSLCLKKEFEASLSTLEKAIDLGYNDYKWISQDPDFEQLRENLAFQNLVQSLQP